MPLDIIILALLLYLTGVINTLIPSNDNAMGIAAKIINYILFFSVIAVQPTAIAVGLLALFRIKKSKGLLRGESIANTAMVIASCWIALAGSMFVIVFLF
ncbi:MAG: hypothetical protein ABIH42_06055 [Planctomycetota bacterium]